MPAIRPQTDAASQPKSQQNSASGPQEQGQPSGKSRLQTPRQPDPAWHSGLRSPCQQAHGIAIGQQNTRQNRQRVALVPEHNQIGGTRALQDRSHTEARLETQGGQVGTRPASQQSATAATAQRPSPHQASVHTPHSDQGGNRRRQNLQHQNHRWMTRNVPTRCAVQQTIPHSGWSGGKSNLQNRLGTPEGQPRPGWDRWTTTHPESVAGA